jgi:putative endonuclease
VNKQPAVYILASKQNGTLYIGVTSELVKRIWEHKNDMVEGFTKRYGVHVWFGMKYMRVWNPLLSGRND